MYLTQKTIATVPEPPDPGNQPPAKPGDNRDDWVTIDPFIDNHVNHDYLLPLRASEQSGGCILGWDYGTSTNYCMFGIPVVSIL